MGEAKRKHRRHADIISNASGCVYCAASSSAEQIDHMPPRAMFRMNQRPKGLEFPSCAACNQGTSKLDVVATFMARTFPGIGDEADSAEWDRVMGEINRVAPGLFREMWVPREQMEAMLWSQGITDRELAAFRADGPILSAHMQAFAAKVGFALHYEATGQVVPEQGRVQVRWFTSGEIIGDQLPESLFNSIGPVQLMKQGKITSELTFEYGWGEFEQNRAVNLCYAKVREAFVVAAFVVDDASKLPFPEGDLATFAPGDLRNPPHDRIMDGHHFAHFAAPSVASK
ncbi:hypothetical protein [Mesorhizobium sp.]|uniref:hypothetical protein n=1 Tax=Mesorhizobium sp. TaxID=1871066 RepID=UPI000FE68C56|nr:hypothetical protein [Mesorhizobium sp.]RWD44078.1 MAG: hypothetical protein EOS35_18165 [Mesorhizobium sp.]